MKGFILTGRKEDLPFEVGMNLCFMSPSKVLFVVPAFSMERYRDQVFHPSVCSSTFVSTLTLTLMFKFITQESLRLQ